MHCICNATPSNCTATHVKTSALPSLRVTPALREAALSVLKEGESLTNLIETAVIDTIERRQSQAAFAARGLQAKLSAAQTSEYHAAQDVHAELQRLLDSKRKQIGMV